MPISHKKIIPFMRNGIQPYFLSLKDLFQGKYEILEQDKIQSEQDLNSEIQSTQEYISDTESDLTSTVNQTIENITNEYDQISGDVSGHLQDTTNPHEVKFSQITSISPTDPLPSQGVNGDTWLTYLNPIYYFETSPWTECSVECGGGVQSRSVVCKRDDGVSLLDSICLSAGLVKPVTSRECNTQICPLTLTNIAVSTPRGSTLDQTIQRYTFDAAGLGFQRLNLGAVTISDSCGRDYAFAIKLGGVYIYKLTFQNSPIGAALVEETTTQTVCNQWTTRGILANKIINLPAAQKFVGSVLEFHIYMKGGDDCCKGMNFSNIFLN